MTDTYKHSKRYIITEGLIFTISVTIKPVFCQKKHPPPAQTPHTVQTSSTRLPDVWLYGPASVTLSQTQ